MQLSTRFYAHLRKDQAAEVVSCLAEDDKETSGCIPCAGEGGIAQTNA